MPISEDEYDHHKTQHHGMSKAEQRRSNKPIMEKRRRARINHCLNELKALILDAMKKDPARHSKLEKADILEMTVKHLQTIQRQQLAVAVATDPTVLHKFKTGFNECATEVSRYISHIDGVEPAVKQRLVAHLANCVSGLQQLSPFTFGNSNVMNAINSVFPSMGSAALHLPLQGPNTQSNTSGLPTILPQISSGDVNNNHHHSSSTRLQMTGGLQLIPSRLPTGELALLLPNTGQLPGNVLPFFPPPTATTQATTTSTLTAATVTSTHTAANKGPPSTMTSGSIDRTHPSAFTAVMRSQSPVSTQPRSRSPCIPQNTCIARMKSGSPGPLSPTSSISSCDTTDTYPSPNSPPPPPHHLITQHISLTGNNHQTQILSYPTISTSQFKAPHENSSAALKTYHIPVMELQKPPPSPQQQPQVTSTSSPALDIPGKMKPPAESADSSTGLLNTLTEVKLAFKTVSVSTGETMTILPTSSNLVPMTSTNHPFHQSVTVASSTPMDQCLSVVTSGTTFADSQQYVSSKEPPLDFSFKKDDFQSTSTQTVSGNKRQTSVVFTCSDSSRDLQSHSLPPRNKIMRFSFAPNETNQRNSPKMRSDIEEGLLKCSESKTHIAVVVEDLSNKPSTSTAVTSSAAQTNTKDMWRPW